MIAVAYAISGFPLPLVCPLGLLFLLCFIYLYTVFHPLLLSVYSFGGFILRLWRGCLVKKYDVVWFWKHGHVKQYVVLWFWRCYPMVLEQCDGSRMFWFGSHFSSWCRSGSHFSSWCGSESKICLARERNNCSSKSSFFFFSIILQNLSCVIFSLTMREEGQGMRPWGRREEGGGV